MNAASGYILAVDLGTSGPKAALVNPKGEIVAHRFAKVDTFFLPGGGVEQDPFQWWEALGDAARGLLESTGVKAGQIKGVCCTSQWACTLAVDEKGSPLMNALSWMDSRGAAPMADIVKGPIRFEGYDLFKLIKWIRLTGGMPSTAGREPACHIQHIKTARPDIYEKTYKFLDARDYINLRLTGQFCTSPDCMALHWVTDNRKISNVRYSDSLIRMSGMERDKLPDIRPAAGIIGALTKEAARHLNLDPSTPVAMGCPDLHSAAIGSGATDDFAGHLCLGTSSWLICHVPYKKTDPFNKLVSLPAAIPGKYLLINSQEIAGEALNILKDNLGFGREPDTPEDGDIHQNLNRMASRVEPGSGGLIFTPWFNGERTPVDDSLIRAGFHNLNLSTTQAHMVRAVFEGVAYNSRWLLQCVEKFIRRPMPRINIIGGGAQSDLWCQIHADVLDRPIRRVKSPGLCNARGAGLMAWAALGEISFDQIPELTEFERVFTPNPDNRELYSRLFRRFVEVYRNNRKWYRKLNTP